ncbi:MAG: hypothetical protein WCF71_10290 [Verrucomicrobiia bacterium]
MKTNIEPKYVLMFVLALCGTVSFGHEVPVHRRITQSATDAAGNDSPGYGDFLNIISADCGTPLAVQCMVEGSAAEDAPTTEYAKDAGGWRSYNHFYDPLDTTYGKGLSDVPNDHRSLVGTNSFAWGSISNCLGVNYGGYFGVAANNNTVNAWSWQNARGYEWLGLTATNALDRTFALENMFEAIGHEMHLLQDTSQPQHVRNEQHLDKRVLIVWAPWHSSIEKYGLKNVSKLNYQAGVQVGMLDWWGDGFTKLQDFWDRGKYQAQGVTALNADKNGGANTLGLAEYSNGNFIGDRHKYAEYYTPDNVQDIRYYPYPARKSYQTNDYPLTLKNGDVITRRYLTKSGDGISVTHHSALTFWGVHHPNIMKAKSTTIRDDNVLQEYHDNFIPKAVEYSAGLLDYFFRGTMDVSLIGYDTNLVQYTTQIVNTSPQDFSGGAFYLLLETNGVRTLVQSNALSGILASGAGTSMTFSGLWPTNQNKLFLVYQGTIGVTNGTNALDPVDAGIGIAASRLWINMTNTYYYQPSLASLGLTNGSTITTNLESDDFGFTPTAGNYEVIVNFAKFDDTGTIGSLTCHMSDDPSCTLPDEITDAIVPADQVTVVGNHLSVPVTATDDPICGDCIGWWTITITWRAWPEP